MERFLSFFGFCSLLLISSLDLAIGDNDDYQCQGLYEYDASTVGTVSNPFYGKREYHNGLLCEYRIRAPEGYRIKITFKDLDIDPSDGCVQDRLCVFIKDTERGLGCFCGSELPNPLLSNEGENEVTLIFASDFMVGGRGFLLQYESSPYFTSLCETGFSECVNRKCYKNERKCDGVDDCGDGTDEEDCGQQIAIEPEKCGQPEIEPITNSQTGSDRMVGGEAVIPNSWPWQVSLRHNYSEPNGHVCGGTLINAQWVLTATHCVDGLTDPGDIIIHLGAHGKFKKTQYEQIRRSKKVIAYPDLEGDNISKYDMKHDISLIKLNAPVTFNKGVQPGCLPQLGWKAEPGSHCFVTGWGQTRGTGGSDVLKQMEQVVQPRTNCSFNEQSQICLEKHRNSPCHGDSGGPLNCKLGDKWFVFGAASFITSTAIDYGLCAGPNAMIVYASSADKADWIKTVINIYS